MKPEIRAKVAELAKDSLRWFFVKRESGRVICELAQGAPKWLVGVLEGAGARGDAFRRRFVYEALQVIRHHVEGGHPFEMQADSSLASLLEWVGSNEDRQCRVGECIDENVLSSVPKSALLRTVLEEAQATEKAEVLDVVWIDLQLIAHDPSLWQLQ